jgi:DNA-binding GntR family transcriptional regulator
MAESGNHDGFCRENRRFHEIVYSASRTCAKQLKPCETASGPYRRYVTYQPGRMAAPVLEHKAVMRPILFGNVNQAQATMQDHVNLLGDQFADFLSALSSNADHASAIADGAATKTS